MTESKQKRGRQRRNAFERANEARLAFDDAWWASLAGADVSEIAFSPPEYIQLGDETTIVGGLVLDRRIITYRVREGEDEQTEVVTRPVTTRFSALPIDLLERIALDIVAVSDAKWRELNIGAAVAAAQSFSEDEQFDIAREVLGPNASDEEVSELAGQIRMPGALVEGGDAAAAFFDQYMGVVTLTGEEGEEQIADAPPEPGRTDLLTGEWDYYTPEDIEHYGGPESDGAYAFRIVRLCEAIRSQPDAAIQLAVQLGAITREWEMWRENEEFIRAGRAHFAQQSRLAKSRNELPWMTLVRQDLESGHIGDNIAQYARKFAREKRHLKPPGIDRIRNFVSELRRNADGRQ